MSNTYNFPKQIAGDTYKGASFEILSDGMAIDLTGALIDIKFRYFDFTGAETLSLSVGDGIVLSDPEAGVFSIPPFVVDMEVGKHVYDCQITLSGVTKTYFCGVMTVTPNVTY